MFAEAERIKVQTRTHKIANAFGLTMISSPLLLYLLLAPSVLHLMSPVTADLPIEGDYRLLALYDSSDTALAYPEGDYPLKVSIDHDVTPLKYQLFLVIGNHMWTSAVQNDDGSVSMGPMASTKMYPGMSLFLIDHMRCL